MSLIPNFELGLWNAWIFMIWLVILPFLTNLITVSYTHLRAHET